jgi:hypothetical protein
MSACLSTNKLDLPEGSSFSNVIVRKQSGLVAAFWNAPSQRKEDGIEVLLNFRNDLRHLWTLWWLRELNDTYPFLQLFVRSIRLWAEGEGLMGESGRNRLFSGPMLQYMAIHVAMQEGLIPVMDWRLIRELKKRSDQSITGWTGAGVGLSNQPPPSTEKTAETVCRLIRSFFQEFKDFDFDTCAVQLIDPLILCDQGSEHPPTTDQPAVMRIHDPWGHRKEGAEVAEPGKNVAAHVRTTNERRYFQSCCRFASHLLFGSDDVDPSALGLQKKTD